MNLKDRGRSYFSSSTVLLRTMVLFFLLIIFLITFIPFSCTYIDSPEKKTIRRMIDSLNTEFDKEIKYDTSRLTDIYALIRIADSIDYHTGISRAAITGSRIYMSDFQNEKALEMLELADKAMKRTNDPALAALVSFYQGRFNFRINNSDVALDFFLKALQKSLEAPDTALYVKSLTNIGNLYLERGNLEKAKEYFDKSVNVNKKRNDLVNLAIDHHHLSVYYLRKGELDSAKYFLDRELLLSKDTDNLMLYIINLNNLASFYIETGNYEEGEKNSMEALRLIDSISDLYPPTASKSVVHANLGVLYKNKKDFHTALYHFNLAYQDTVYNYIPEFRIKLFFDMYNTYKELGYHDSSHYFIGQYLRLRDMNDKIVADQNLLAMEMRYNFKQIQQEHEHKQQRIRLLFYGSISLFVVGLFAMVMFIQKQRIKIKNDQLLKNIQEIKLERLNRELASQALNMVRINERKINLIKTLKDRMPSFKRENQLIVSSIIDDLEKDKNELAWKEFEMRFTEVHSDFYKKLSEINPSLTINEKRLCAFLLLDMTTKEISSITGQSLRAIEQARTRLRKQLYLTNSNVSITTFLSSL